MADEEPSWVRREREAKELEGLKHVPGQPMTRCPVCWNKGPYCTCESVTMSQSPTPASFPRTASPEQA